MQVEEAQHAAQRCRVVSAEVVIDEHEDLLGRE